MVDFPGPACDANLKEQRVSWACIASGPTLTTIKVLPWPFKHGLRIGTADETFDDNTIAYNGCLVLSESLRQELHQMSPQQRTIKNLSNVLKHITHAMAFNIFQ